MASLWRDSGLSFTDFLPEAQDIHTFISQQVGGELLLLLLLSAHVLDPQLLLLCGHKQKLQFVLWDGSGPDAATSTKMLSPEDLGQQLDRLLLEDMASDEQIFDWVEV